MNPVDVFPVLQSGGGEDSSQFTPPSLKYLKGKSVTQGQPSLRLCKKSPLFFFSPFGIWKLPFPRLEGVGGWTLPADHVLAEK